MQGKAQHTATQGFTLPIEAQQPAHRPRPHVVLVIGYVRLYIQFLQGGTTAIQSPSTPFFDVTTLASQGHDTRPCKATMPDHASPQHPATQGHDTWPRKATTPGHTRPPHLATQGHHTRPRKATTLDHARPQHLATQGHYTRPRKATTPATQGLTTSHTKAATSGHKSIRSRQQCQGITCS